MGYLSHKTKLARLRHVLINNLVYLRKDVFKLSYAKLALSTGVTIKSLRFAEVGKRLPELPLLCKLSSFYNIPVADLISVDLKHRDELQAKKAIKKAERDAAILARLNIHK